MPKILLNRRLYLLMIMTYQILENQKFVFFESNRAYRKELALQNTESP